MLGDAAGFCSVGVNDLVSVWHAGQIAGID